MNNFNLIYKILRLLDKHKGDEDFDFSLISAERLGVGYSEWEQILIELQRNDFVRGIVYTQSPGEKFPHICEPVTPSITLKGMEYLAENGMMEKAKNALKMLGEII